MPVTKNTRGQDESVAMLEVPFAIRNGDGFDCHSRLSGKKLSERIAACSQGCTHRLGTLHHRISRRVALTLLFVLTLLHPILHAFEGGALDALFVGLMARLAVDE